MQGLISGMFFILNVHLPLKAFSHLSATPLALNPANSLCEAIGGGKERVPPGCLSPGASLRVVGVFYRRTIRMRVVLCVARVELGFI